MVFGEAIAAGRMAAREAEGTRMETRDIAAVLIGLEAGLAIGLFGFGTTLFAPMGMGVLGAAVGYGVRRGRLQLIRRALRAQLRGAR